MEHDSPTLSVSAVVGWASLLTANVTVALQPWILGGAIPLSRLTLQIGTVAALSLSLLSVIFAGRRIPRAIPVLLWPLLGLAAIGIFQLLPIHESPFNRMSRAVVPFDGVATVAEDGKTALSVSVGDTRLRIAQLFALACLFLAVLDQVYTRRRLTTSLVLQAGNAALMSAVALAQLVSGSGTTVADPWIRSKTRPFAAFVNPNNAAGWLCAQLAFVVALFLLTRPVHSRALRKARRSAAALQSRVRSGWNEILAHVASLNASVVSILLCGALVLTAIMATFSRGGILATLVVILLTLWIGKARRSVLTWIVAGSVIAGAIGVAVLLQLDQSVLSEMETLSDPLTAGSSRLEHWRDTLACVADFPWFGSGLGGYQFATLPYQTTDHAWYRNADNQYVELLVETGVAGVVTLLVAVFLLLRLLRQLQQVRRRQRHQNGLSDIASIMFVWLLMMITGQAICAVFDFGISLTATSSLFVFGISCGLAALVALNRGEPSLIRPVATEVGTLAAITVRLGVCLAAAAMIPDIWRASQIYDSVIRGARVDRERDLQALLEQLPEAQLSLHDVLKDRPDDSEGLMMATSLASTAFRAGLMAQWFPDQTVSGDEYKKAWARTNPGRLASQILLFREKRVEGIDRLERIALQELGRTQLPAIQLKVLARLPLVPSLHAEHAYQLAWTYQRSRFRAAALTALQTDPSSAFDLFQLGRLAGQLGDSENAELFWTQSLKAGPQMQAAVLVEASQIIGIPAAIEKYGPRSYRRTMQCLRDIRSKDLLLALLNVADNQWEIEQTGDD
jgi:O-antigen ligase